MRRVTMGAIALAAVCIAAAPAGGSTSERRVTLDSYCADTGDYCLAVKSKGTNVRLQIESLAFRGEYKLCVRGPERKKCSLFQLGSSGGGSFFDSVNWNRTFGYEGKGNYQVSWFLSGQKLGKTLGFSFS